MMDFSGLSNDLPRLMALIIGHSRELHANDIWTSFESIFEEYANFEGGDMYISIDPACESSVLKKIQEAMLWHKHELEAMGLWYVLNEPASGPGESAIVH